jgi:ATP-dependent helicase/nuclease subunit A
MAMEAKQRGPELNNEQRAAAFCTENAVVAAGAGSGKTMVLASRYAWLVTEKDYRIDEILTLTFTKKAAAQMYRRIYAMLGEIASENFAVTAKRTRQSRLAEQALDNFIHARIQTLDSYCAALVKQAAPRYGISPDFVIDEDRCRDLALEESLPFLIAHRHHPAIERLYPQKGPEEIARSIFAAAIFDYGHIGETAGFTDDLRSQFDIIRAEWEKQCGNIGNLLRELAELVSRDEALLPDLVPLINQYISGAVVFPGAAEIRGFFDFLSGQSDPIAEAESHPLQASIAGVLEFLAALNALDLRRGRRSGNTAKEIIKQFRDSIFGEFSSLAVFCMQAGLIVSIMSLLSELRQRYLNKKRAEGVLTFSDVARLARTILLEQEDIRQSEKESFRAIMIDEFQDNNALQKDLLFLLAEKTEQMGRAVPSAGDLLPGKLFFVGDEKQSIYRFRGADVSVFRKLKEELGSAALPLTTNYRSAPLLIGAFNAIFGGVFDPEGHNALPEKPAVFAPAAGTPLPLYEAAYTPLRPGREGGGTLTLCVLDKKDEDEADGEETPDTARLSAVENEARFVAERIQRLLEEKNDAGGVKYHPDDIAILFRARSPQHLFEKHLRMLNIPYASEDLNGFFFGGPVNDIMSVLRLAAYPLDAAAYAEMLRSPFAGLSMRGLTTCLAIFNRDEAAEPFTDDPIPHLRKKDQIKYQWGQQIYSLIRDKARRESVSSLVSELWYSQGYRYETEWNPQTAVYRELYDYLFYLAAKADADNQGLAAFTDSIQALRDSGKPLTGIDIPLEHPSAVRLLTVHKSKGLEFPVVFLCCCDRHSQRSGGGDVYDTGGSGIAFNPPLPRRCPATPGIRRNFFWERSLAEEKRKKTAELRRLLYVGMTRAENELYLTGCLNIGNNDADGSPRAVGSPRAAGGRQDDFPLRLQEYVNEKREKAAGKNAIAGDAILDDDTFFGLCLPALCEHIAPSSFFSIEKIPAYTETHVEAWEHQSAALSNDQNGLNAFFEKTEALYRNVEVIRTPQLRGNRVTPTSLEADLTTAVGALAAYWNFITSADYSGADSGDVFQKVDALLARFGEQDEENGEKFNSGGFGTIAHACVEALLNGEEAVIPPALAGFLNPAEAGAFLEAGTELAARFLCSPLGKTAQAAVLRKSEFPFRSLVKDSGGNDIFISGTIDLLFEDTAAFHVVDFKTDIREQPWDHLPQMACYYRAASALFAAPVKKDCRLWLYYLRTGHAVEMSEQANRELSEKAGA